MDKSDGNYQDTPYNSISSGQNVQVVINGIRGKLAKQAIDAVGIAFYTENGTFIKSLSETGTHSIPSSATKYAFTINNPNVGEPHITINEDTVDIETNTTRDGYIDSKGQYHYSELFKCSELLPINQGEIYFDSLATSLLYEFTRLEEGRETKIGVGNVFLTLHCMTTRTILIYGLQVRILDMNQKKIGLIWLGHLLIIF